MLLVNKYVRYDWFMNQFTTSFQSMRYAVPLTGRFNRAKGEEKIGHVWLTIRLNNILAKTKNLLNNKIKMC